MLLYMYQIFSSLRSHLHFFVHFFFTFMEYFFFGHPILTIKPHTAKPASASKSPKPHKKPPASWVLGLVGFRGFVGACGVCSKGVVPCMAQGPTV